MNVDENTVLLALVVVQLQRLIPKFVRTERHLARLLKHFGLDVDEPPPPTTAAQSHTTATKVEATYTPAAGGAAARP